MRADGRRLTSDTAGNRRTVVPPLGSPGSSRRREDLLDLKAPCGQSPQQFGFGSLEIEPSRAILVPSKHDLTVVIGGDIRLRLRGQHSEGAVLDQSRHPEEPSAG